MVMQYFTGTINFDKLSELNDYLKEKGFEPSKGNHLLSFRPNLENRVWTSEDSGIQVRIHNRRYNLFIQTSSREKEDPLNKKLITNIMEIVESSSLYNGAGSIVKF